MGNWVEQAPPCHTTHGARKLALILSNPGSATGVGPGPSGPVRHHPWAERSLGRVGGRLSPCFGVSAKACGWGPGFCVDRRGGSHGVLSLGELSCAVTRPFGSRPPIGGQPTPRKMVSSRLEAWRVLPDGLLGKGFKMEAKRN